MSAAGRLVIYHTSDIHAHRGFGERLATLVEPEALLVDCGDALSGSSVFYSAREDVIADLARAPYQAMAVGNREFHYLHPLFNERARKLPMPLVCSNLIDVWGRQAVYQRELILDVGGAPIRLLGLLVPQYRTRSGWERVFGWRFLAPEVALREMLPHDATPTVVLSHLGLPADRQLARTFPGLAAILGGHSHVALHQPEMIGNVPVAHPGAYGENVGRLELSIDAGQTRVVSYRLLPLLAATSHRHEAVNSGARS